MNSSFKQLCWRSALLLLGGLSILAVLGFIALGVLLVRVAAAPMDVSFAKPYVQQVLRSPETGTYATMDKLVLHWPELKGPLLLGITQGKVINAEGNPIVSIDEVALSLSKSKLLIGQVSPIALILKRPDLQVVRKKDGSIDVGFGDVGHMQLPQNEGTVEAQTSLATTILEYIARPGMKAEEGSPLSTLRSFQIEQAHVVFDDIASESSFIFPRVDAAFRSAEEGLSVSLALEMPAPEDAAAARLEAETVLPWEAEKIALNIQIENFALKALAKKMPSLEALQKQDIVLNGTAKLDLDRNFNILQAQFDVASDSGVLRIADLSGEDFLYQDFIFQSNYDAARKLLSVGKLQITGKGVTVQSASDFVVNDHELVGRTKVQIDKITHDKVVELWPATLHGDKSEEWIIDKPKGGTLRDVFANIDLRVDLGRQEVTASLDDINAGFSFENIGMDYRPPLTPVTEASGEGRFNYRREQLSITVHAAKIGELEVSEAELEFINIIEKGKGVADINTKVTGPLDAGVRYLELEPIHLDHDFDVAAMKGQLDLMVNLNFPTHEDIKKEEVKIKVSGQAQDITLPNALRGLPLTGGPYQIDVQGNTVRLKGAGQLDGRDIDLDYMAFLNSEKEKFKNKATATLMADEALRTKLEINLSDFLEGPAPVKVVQTEYQSGRAVADITADLRKAHLFIEPFGYDKPIGTPGQATLRVHLNNSVLQEIENLNVTGPDLKIENARFVFRERGEETEISQGQIPSLVIGQTVGRLELEVDAAGRQKVLLDGSFLDLRPFLESDDNPDDDYDSPPLLISVAADRIRTSDDGVIRFGKIYADIDAQGKFNQLELDAVAGSGDVYLRYKPDAAGMRTFRFEADDAGETLRAFGVYDKIQGGKMVIYGEPIRGVSDRNLIGVAEITDFKVVNAPTLARLLSALSLGGVLDLLNNDGLGFSKLEAKFDWLFRKQGSMLVLQDGRTSGNSVGFTFDGKFDNAASHIDVNGTIVPLSGINKVLGSIPLLGEILTGGSGVIAATYSVKGPAKDPKVSVNPLSVLTPGILRRILFEQN